MILNVKQAVATPGAYTEMYRLWILQQAGSYRVRDPKVFLAHRHLGPFS